VTISPVVRNVAIVAALAAVVAFAPGGGTGTRVIITGLSILFLASLGWVAGSMYRQHRVSLYSLGDTRRAALYAAAAVLTVTLTGTSRLWQSPLGQVAWLILVGGAVYVGFAVLWAARRY
jgi:hypothetical protein